MDALRYLIQRKWPAAGRVGTLLLLSTGLCWLNYKITLLVPAMFPSLFDNFLVGLVWGLLVMAAGLLSISTFLGITLIVPLYAIYRLTNTLHAWIRQRAVEEMVCAGMSGRGILDQMAWFGARWWLQASLPAALASLVLFPELRSPYVGPLLGGYLLAGAVVTYLGLFSTAWSGFASGKVKTPLLGALLVVQGVPALGLLLGGVSPGSLLAAGLYVVVVARYCAIYALENAESLSQMDLKIRRRLRLKKSAARRLSENPIAARETMRGLDSADLISRAVTVVCFGFTAVAAVALQATWLFALLVLSVVLLNSYRAAGKMSQIVTEEMESSTLETLRSTPMSSDDFLNGWLRSVLRLQWLDLAVLLAGVFAMVALMGDLALLGSPMVLMGLCLAVALPAAGAYIGASIAGQGKPRAQISGQLLASFAGVAVVGGPHMMVSAEIVSLPASLLMLMSVTAGLCWVLQAGARKSLNRIFLPQR